MSGTDSFTIVFLYSLICILSGFIIGLCIGRNNQ
jgi:hypothetical protein